MASADRESTEYNNNLRWEAELAAARDRLIDKQADVNDALNRFTLERNARLKLEEEFRNAERLYRQLEGDLKVGVALRCVALCSVCRVACPFSSLSDCFPSATPTTPFPHCTPSRRSLPSVPPPPAPQASRDENERQREEMASLRGDIVDQAAKHDRIAADYEVRGCPFFPPFFTLSSPVLWENAWYSTRCFVSVCVCVCVCAGWSVSGEI